MQLQGACRGMLAAYVSLTVWTTQLCEYRRAALVASSMPSGPLSSDSFEHLQSPCPYHPAPVHDRRTYCHLVFRLCLCQDVANIACLLAFVDRSSSSGEVRLPGFMTFFGKEMVLCQTIGSRAMSIPLELSWRWLLGLDNRGRHFVLVRGRYMLILGLGSIPYAQRETVTLYTMYGNLGPLGRSHSLIRYSFVRSEYHVSFSISAYPSISPESQSEERSIRSPIILGQDWLQSQ